MGMGDRRKNSEISQNRISTEWMEAERGEEDASRVSAGSLAKRQAAQPLELRSMSFWGIIGISEEIG